MLGLVAVCVDDDKPSFRYVLIEGTAEVSTDLDEMSVWVTPTGVVARKSVAD
jgi:hypothetical protein